MFELDGFEQSGEVVGAVEYLFLLINIEVVEKCVLDFLVGDSLVEKDVIVELHKLYEVMSELLVGQILGKELNK